MVNQLGQAAAAGLVEQLAAEVELDLDTREALADVLLDEREAALEIGQQHAEPEARREAFAKLRREYEGLVDELLDEEQFGAYQQLRSRRG